MAHKSLRLVVTGAGGRMGRMLIKAATEKGHIICAALDQEGSAVIGQDAGILAGIGPLNLPVTSDALEAFVQADGVLDFTRPQASVEYAALAAQARLVHVIGTTGFSEEEKGRLQAAARHARIIQSGNMSLGVNLLSALVKKAAHLLNEEFDIEIVEMHHRNKVDAPSGTALMLGEAAAQGRSISLKEHAITGRHGISGIRPAGDIGFASLRGGTVIGDHSVIFAGPSERIELTHKAEDRSLFAYGALKAVLWGINQKPGYYTMEDVLGLQNF